MQVAQHLASQLPSTFGYFVDNPDANGSVLLTITNANGFTLRGVTVNAISQATQSGNTAVTRSTQVTQTPGNATETPVLFSAATVTLTGTTAVGDLWTLTVGGVVNRCARPTLRPPPSPACSARAFGRAARATTSPSRVARRSASP